MLRVQHGMDEVEVWFSHKFCKHTGRKRALVDALFSLPKDLRTVIWKEYGIQCGF